MSKVMTSMIRAALIVLLGAILGQVLVGDTLATPHLNQLVEHWRWMQYWEGRTELGSEYVVGRRLEAILFWKADAAPPSVGFCELGLGFCQFYPDTFMTYSSYVMPLQKDDNLHSAYARFLESAFGQYDSPIWKGQQRPAGPKAADYQVELVTVDLPPLGLPKAVRERKPRPPSEIKSLVAKFSCTLGSPDCGYHLLIPFYDEHDPVVPIYSECKKDCRPRDVPTILFFQLIDGNWWRGATAFSGDPAYVKRTREQIERALMTEVGQ